MYTGQSVAPESQGRTKRGLAKQARSREGLEGMDRTAEAYKVPHR